MFCTKCGNQIKDGFKFCPKCGTPVYAEKEKEENEVKPQVGDVKKEASMSQTIYIPNPLIAEELDIEGVKKKAEQGDKEAILRQAFRYEMGIGVEKDIDKAKELYEKAGGKDCIITTSASMYFFNVELNVNLCKTSK